MDKEAFNDLLDILSYVYKHVDEPVKAEIDRRLKVARIKQAGGKFLIGANSIEEAERIARTHNLRRSQWIRAHVGFPKRHLRDGLGMVREEFLLGKFTTEERVLLTGKC